MEGEGIYHLGTNTYIGKFLNGKKGMKKERQKRKKKEKK